MADPILQPNLPQDPFPSISPPMVSQQELENLVHLRRVSEETSILISRGAKIEPGPLSTRLGDSGELVVDGESTVPDDSPSDTPAPSTAVPVETPCDFTGHLAAGRLKAEGGPTSHIDSIDYLLDRVQALVEIVKEACHSKSDSEFPKDYLLLVMSILQEDVEVARRLADELDDLYREAGRAKAD